MSGGMSDQPNTRQMPQTPDCTSCKIIGAGGCFAGAVYAFYQRGQLPTSNRNRHWLALIGTALTGCNAIFCSSCDQQQCPEAKDCTAGTVLDVCGCCNVCAIPKEGSCSTEEVGLCAEGTFCLPDGGLLSGSTTGKCLEMTECFSFGCDVVDDDESCECAYSNSCPTKTFAFNDLLSCEVSISENSTDNSTETEEESELCVSFGCEIEDDLCECNTSDSCPTATYTYSTQDDCEAALKVIACAQVECALPHVECPEGSYYEPGPQLPGECCPSSGLCWCDEELCPAEPDCGEGFVPYMIATANDTEGQCCDFYGCKAEVCLYGDKVLENNQIVKPNPCTTCRCFEGEVACHTLSCFPPRCGYNEELVFLPEQCCPTCRPREVIDPPQISLCKIEGEFTDPENPCLLCTCYNGNTACLEQICPTAECASPVLLPGVCCPVCEPTPTTVPTTEPITEERMTTGAITEERMTTGVDITDASTVAPSTTEETKGTSTAETEMSTTEPELTTTGSDSSEETTEVVTEKPEEPEVPKPTIPFQPRQCSRFGPYRSTENRCLTCMCIYGRERCVDQSKSLCGVPRCENPVMIEGECCPVCIGSSDETLTPLTPSVDISPDDVTLVTVVMDIALDDNNDYKEIVEMIESEMAQDGGYTLVDLQMVSRGKTQIELLLAVEVQEGSEISGDEIVVYLLERLSSASSSPSSSTTSEDSQDVDKMNVSDSDIVLVVCVASVLVAVIVLAVFGIFLATVWIARQNKKRKQNEQKNEQKA